MLETEAAQDGANQLNNDGPPWLKKLPAISTQAPNLNLNLNVAPPVIEQDLNEQPLADDPQEVLILPLPQINHPQEIANQQMAEIAIQQSVPAETVIHPEGMMEEVAENQLEDGPPVHPKRASQPPTSRNSRRGINKRPRTAESRNGPTHGLAARGECSEFACGDG